MCIILMSPDDPSSLARYRGFAEAYGEAAYPFSADSFSKIQPGEVTSTDS